MIFKVPTMQTILLFCISEFSSDYEQKDNNLKLYTQSQLKHVCVLKS